MPEPLAEGDAVREGRTTYIDPNQLPPLRPLRVGGKVAISVERPGDFLIRAWCPTRSTPDRLLDWILHHIGRRDFDGLVWWGMTYPGQPIYMSARENWYTSGLTIQKYVEPRDKFTAELVERGTLGHAYGLPDDLEIPEKGAVQVRHG